MNTKNLRDHIPWGNKTFALNEVADLLDYLLRRDAEREEAEHNEAMEKQDASPPKLRW